MNQKQQCQQLLEKNKCKIIERAQLYSANDANRSFANQSANNNWPEEIKKLDQISSLL